MLAITDILTVEDGMSLLIDVNHFKTINVNIKNEG